MNQTGRRLGYVFLCVLPFLDLALVSARPIRTSGMAEVVGIPLFAAVLIALWAVRPRVGLNESATWKLALAGFLLILPWAVIALLWVGLGPPFQATLSENYMRYLALVWNSVAVTSAFVVLKDALHETGERFFSTAGFAAALSAGVAYFVCLNVDLAQVAMRLHGDKTPMLQFMVVYFYNSLEFVACILTYVSTAMFAIAMSRAGLLGSGAARFYVAASAVLMVLIIMRGLDFPEISGNTAPLYTRPGVVAGIPAIPWFLPGLLGAVLLWRAANAPVSVTSDDGARAS